MKPKPASVFSAAVTGPQTHDQMQDLFVAGKYP
jgi:hypothetical protein